MLHLILGRAKTGKTEQIMRTIRQEGKYRPQVLLVPEQLSHDMERLLCARCGAEASRYAEVLSFTRLAHRVFTQAGGLAAPQLDGGGRLLLMSQAVAAVSGSLRVYARPSRKAAFLEQLLATGDELKSYSVRPQELIRAGEEQEGETGDRLRDLGLILETYDAMVAQRAADPRDRLTRLAEALEGCPWFRGKDVYLDGFTDFTPQQRLVLRQMLGQANRVTAALTCDRLEEGESVFAPQRRTALELAAVCRELHVSMDYETLTERKDGAGEGLIELERQLFSDEAVMPTEGEGVCLFTGENPYDEVEWTAGEILRLVKERGWHFRDIAVAARTLDRYEGPLETVFRRYRIPLFLGRVEPILEKPVLTLLTAALDSIRSHYEYEDIFRYLKTGLTGLEWEETDLLENYVLQWDIRGSRWSREADWSWHPRGFGLDWEDADRALLARLNELRRRVIRPLETLAQHRQGTGAELADALYQFLEEIDLPRRLTERANALREEGELQQAEEYRQLWSILLQALEQCYDLLDEQVMELDYFSDLFRLVLSQSSVSAIPVSLDRVNGGEMARLAHCQCRALFLLGVDDELFPLISQSPGLLTDEDRTLLTVRGLELAPTAERRLDREQTMAYDAMTRPSELLVLTCPRQAGGGEKRPAVLWRRAEALFPEAERGQRDPGLRLLAPLPALELGAERRDKAVIDRLAQQPGWESVSRRLEQAARADRGRLSPQGVRDVYGSRAALSASRMDKLKSCHFSYFCQYGLKAQARRRAGFDAPATGTFVHAVLEQVLQSAHGEGGVARLTQERRRALTAQAVQDYVNNQLGGLEDQSPRLQYLFHRMLASVELIVQNVVEELQGSQFQPIAFELGFGRGKELPPVQVEVEGITLSISGFVDRVDGWEKDGRLYLRVVDYKTGRKSFSLTDVWHGLSLQMLLYLFTLREQGEDYFGRPVESAGVLYLPARDLLIPGSREMDGDARKRKTDRALRRSGLLLRDEEVLWAMEQWGADGPRFLPFQVSRNGAISGDCLATAEQWGRLERRLGQLLQEMGREIAHGDIDADPYLKGGGDTACQFCDYAQACHFEEGRGTDRRRWLYSVRGKEFWERTGGEQQ
ncbi:MAG: PD-(D/E)XK nuclease family protein [Clostridiales bacterium]|nr:PD-(D/E)XK nuclease family protein [Clostridiales bacterium]